MVKHRDTQPFSPGKMTIMLIQLEGNDATLQEGIRTFKEAMGRAVPQITPRSQLSHAALGALPAPPLESNGEGRSDGETADYVDEGVAVDSPASIPSAASKPAKDRKYPAMDFVKDLDLHPQDKKSFKVFAEEKGPANQTEKITVCLYYLCRILKLDGVTAKHVYTCLKDINAKTPNDLPQTIRTIAKRKGYIDASNGDDLKITNPGVNFVDHSLPHGGA